MTGNPRPLVRPHQATVCRVGDLEVIFLPASSSAPAADVRFSDAGAARPRSLNERQTDAEPTLVPACDRNEQCAGSRCGRVRAERSPQHRAVAQALGGAEPTAQDGRVPLGDVDAHVLHQSSGYDAAGKPTPAAAGGEGRVAAAVQTSSGWPAQKRGTVFPDWWSAWRRRFAALGAERQGSQEGGQAVDQAQQAVGEEREPFHSSVGTRHVRPVHVWLVAVAALFAACAPATMSGAPHSSALDCGFRAPTSCWTLGPRYVDRSRQRADSGPPVPRPLPIPLASGSDSTRTPGVP